MAREHDPEVIEREIEQTRADLARTIDALADRLSPKLAAQRGVARLKEEAGHAAAMLNPPKRDDDDDAGSRALIVAGVGVALTVTVVAVLTVRRRKRGRRRRR